MDNDHDKFRQVEIHFAKESKKASTIEGILQILVDDQNLVVASLFKIKACKIDIYSTKSWCSGLICKKNFEIRKELFKKLHLPKQEPRPCKKNKLITLNKEQIEGLNDYLSNYQKNFTLKTLDILISGNNPSGEGESPDSAPFKARYKNEMVPFCILVENLRVKIYLRKTLEATEYCSVLSFEEWIDENEQLKDWFVYLTKEKPHESFKETRKRIKGEVKKHTKIAQKIDDIINNYRSHYTINIKNTYKDFLTHCNYSSKYDFEHCHIKGVWIIKKECYESWMKDQLEGKVKDIASEVKDPCNFLPLPIRIHKMFDDYRITYKKNKLFNVSLSPSEFKKVQSQLLQHNLETIPNFLQCRKRTSYLKWHYKHATKQ